MKRNLLMIVLAAMFGSGCRGVPVIPVVSGFEVEKYLGKWYEISRLPNWFEKGMTDVSVEYFLLENGTIKVVNRGIRDGEEKSITGYARFVGRSDSGDLEVSFFRPFYSPYRIIKLAPDYRYSVVTSADEEYLWILSRTPELTEKDQAEIHHFLFSHGFPVDSLISGQ